MARIRAALETAGYPSAQFAGHSFWIGSATSAAHVGLEDSSIQALGRWSSAAFLVYIRTPAAEVAYHHGSNCLNGKGRATFGLRTEVIDTVCDIVYIMYC